MKIFYNIKDRLKNTYSIVQDKRFRKTARKNEIIKYEDKRRREIYEKVNPKLFTEQYLKR